MLNLSYRNTQNKSVASATFLRISESDYSCMSKHIFLTGPKQIGKSTIIKTYIHSHPASYAGFLTEKSKEIYPGATSVHMLDAAFFTQKKKPSKENFLFFCGQAPDALYHQYNLLPDPAPRFNKIGCAILDTIPINTNIIIMDEIGPHECEAFEFYHSIVKCLDGDIPILGVLQQAESALYRRIAEHPDVEVIKVTKENRNQIAFSFHTPDTHQHLLSRWSERRH